MLAARRARVRRAVSLWLRGAIRLEGGRDGRGGQFGWSPFEGRHWLRLSEAVVGRIDLGGATGS